MLLSIKKPELLNIIDETENKMYFGADQEWYTKAWNREAGCGPTCAANITAYLALNREKCKGLYSQKTLKKEDFIKHMDELFQYVTPGIMGVNHVDKFVRGIIDYGKDKGIALTAQTFSVENCFTKKRDMDKLASFVMEGLSSDCPLAFLNLSRGEEVKLQGWHWITITSARVEADRIIAAASDEGREIQFDLNLWYLTTKLHGGLIYFK